MFRREIHNERYLLRVALAVFVLLGDTPADVHAQNLPADWRVESYVELSSNTLHVSGGSSSATLHSLAAGAGFSLSSRRSPWSTGVFADYQHSDNENIDTTITSGAYVKYRFGQWDAASFVARTVPPGLPSTWLYGAGIRYRVADGHKLGLHTAATASEFDAANVFLRYSGNLGRRLSLSLAYGAGINSFGQRIAALQLTWEVL